MRKIRGSAFKGYAIILCSAILFGSYGVWSRLMGPTFQPFYRGWVRSVIIMLLMLPPMLAGKSFRRIDREDWPALAFFIIFCVFTQVPLYYAYNHAPIGTVQLIFYSVFLLTAYVVGSVYLHEKITKIKLVAIGLALAGLVTVFGISALAFAPVGLALAALNGVASGGEVSSTKKLTDKYPAALIVFWGWVFTLVTHLPISVALGEKVVMPAWNMAWLWLFVYCLVNAAAFWLVVEGYRHVDASVGSLIGLTEIIFTLIFGVIIFHQFLAPGVYAGGAMILLAAMLPDLASLLSGRRPDKAEVPFQDI